MKRINEFALIKRLTSGRHSAADPAIEVGLGDDAAVVSLNEGMRLVAACDTMVETVHFNRWTMRAEDVGFKAMASNVSDIAAMGGVPKFALVSISLPKRYTVKKLERMYRGIYECADRYGIQVIGGDTTSSPRHFMIAVTVLGEVEPDLALRRSCAEPGQAVFITGYPGESAAGLHLLMEERKSPPLKTDDMFRRLIEAHQRPEPNVRAGRILLESGSGGALNDISDGLASELHEISEASGWGMMLDEASLPRSEALFAYAAAIGKDPLEWTCFGGEDYHLVGTIDLSKLNDVRIRFHKENIPFFVIGHVTREETPGGRVWIKRTDGQVVSLDKKGYHHF